MSTSQILKNTFVCPKRKKEIYKKLNYQNNQITNGNDEILNAQIDLNMLGGT